MSIHLKQILICTCLFSLVLHTMDNHPKIGADGRVKNFHLLCPEDQDYILRLEKKVRDQRQIIKQLEKPVENNSKK